MNTLKFIETHFYHFNSGALKRATLDYIKLIADGGKMHLSMAGAMSSARLGISVAPMIRQGKIHSISCTGANLEESIFRLVAHNHYQNFPDYRYFRKQDDDDILEAGHRRVTDMSIPEEEAFRKIEPLILTKWQQAHEKGKSYLPHQYFYDLLLSGELVNLYEGDPNECWLLAAAEMNLPIVVPGWEDSTLGNIFAGYCKAGEVSPEVIKGGIHYMMQFYDDYTILSANPKGLGFFQIGGGIAGDFPICVVPSIKYDLKQTVKPWSYFCQISDSITSFGSYSGATPNEKITWDKLTKTTPMHVIESDATIVVPIMFQAILEMD